ncbi:hypothetical protein SAMD00023378_3929 [Ralstonia sp. NT80]|uniref:hypothetical protein n=1 Tax=Ralstonia sp. NT80 TaxID=1218247 RepID=UPI00073E1AC6|nr:hypothetical protein [Ralstonia sp. NT80]GAQ30246.1 hypothetical protein SAMD00023378_3929 [Ralstonia sp. NT80]
MKTVEIKGWIHAALRSSTPDKPTYSFHEIEDMSFMNSKYTTYAVVMPHTFVVEIPDEQLDYRTVRIAALEKERESVRAELGKRITEINGEISKLQAIELNATEVVEG